MATINLLFREVLAASHTAKWQRWLGVMSCAVALALSASFEIGWRPPVAFSIIVLAVTLAGALILLRNPGFPVLGLYVVALFSLPFINLIGHALHPPDYFLAQSA